MAFQPVENAAQVIIECGDTNQQWTNTLWFEKVGFGEVDMDALVAMVVLWASTWYPKWMQNLWEVQTVQCYDMRTVTGLVRGASLSSSPGLRVGDKAPISIAGVVSFYADGRGRSARGRNYLTGFVEADTGSERITSAGVLADLANAYSALPALATAEGWTWVIAQKWQAGAQLPIGVTRPVIRSEVRNDTFGHQTRRVPRS